MRWREETQTGRRNEGLPQCSGRQRGGMRKVWGEQRAEGCGVGEGGAGHSEEEESVWDGLT